MPSLGKFIGLDHAKAFADEFARPPDPKNLQNLTKNIMIPARGPQTSRYIIFNVYNMDVSLGEEIATAGSAAVKHTAA